MLPKCMWCWMLIHCVQLLSFIKAQEAIGNDGLSEIERRFVDNYSIQMQENTLQLLQNQEKMQFDDGPVPFKMPNHFMHSYRPNTGVGNREDLMIDRILEITLYDDNRFSKWQYARYKNSDFLLARNSKQVVLWEKTIDLSREVELAADENLLPFEPSSTGPVLDSIIFIQRERSTSGFNVAVLCDESNSFMIRMYEVMADRRTMVSLIDLGTRTFDRVEPARKLAYLSSRYAEFLVVLFSNTDTEEIVYNKEGSNVLNHYIKIFYPNAIDILTFSIAGHGYIAVANNSTCTVYRFDEYGQNHKIFHVMYSDGILNLEHFRLGFHSYLAITTANYQALYVARSAEFVLVQEFLQNGVQQIHAALLAECRDDVILFFVKETEFPDIVVWSGKLERFIFVEQISGQNFLPLAGSLTSFNYGRLVFLMFIDQNGISRLLAIQTHLNPLPDPVLAIGNEMSEIMRKLQKTIKDQENTLKSMEAVLANAVKKDGDHKFNAVQSFNDLTSLKGTKAKVAVTNNNIVWEGSQITLSEYLTGTREIEDRIAKLERELDELERILPDIVRVDQDAVIEGPKTFFGEVYGDSVITEYLTVPKTDTGADFVKLQKDLYRVDRPSTIKGVLSFDKPLTVTNDLTVTSGINGIDFGKDVLTTNTNQVSNASMTFENKLVVQGDLAVSGTVNGIEINKEVITLAGNHIVTGHKIFQSGIEAESVSAQLIDGVDLNRLFYGTLTINGDQTISGSKHFTGIVKTNDIEVKTTLNGYNIKELADSIVRTDVPSTLFGHKTFMDDFVVQSSITVGTINGMKIPDDIFLLDRPNTIIGEKAFLGHVKANVVTVDGEVNGLNLPSDIITLSRDEVINGTVNFPDGITVRNDVVVHGLIDGVDINDLYYNAMTLDQLANIEKVIFRGPVTINGNLDILGTVNGISLDITRDIVYKGDTDIVIESEKTFDTVSAGTVTLNGKINNYNLSSDFMTVHGDQIIEGEVIFKKPVTFNNVFVDNEVIGGVNIKELYDKRVPLSQDGEIDGDIEFLDTMIIDGDLTIGGKFGNLSFPGDFVLKSTDQKIKNKVFSGKLRVENLNVFGDIEVQDTFGGLNLQSFFNERVTLSTDQTINGDFTLGNVSASRISIDGLINGVDIAKFANNVMSLTKDQHITGYKEFRGVTNVDGSLTTKQGINGIHLSDIHKRAFKAYEDNIVTADVNFLEDVTFESLEVDGLINGVNITQLDEDSVKTVGPHYITGDTIFHQGFHVEGDISASRVNDLYLPDDILTKDTDQIISGSYTLENVVVDGNINVDGQVNGMNLPEISSLLAKSDKLNVIESDVEFLTPIDVIEDVSVTGLVNGIDLKLLKEYFVRPTGDQRIPGHKIFKGNVTVFGNVDVIYVNDVPWRRFLDDVVRIDVPKTITGRKVFKDGLEVQDLTVTGLADIKRINGIDLLKFQDDVVFVDVPASITGTKIFSAPIQITGDLNAELVNDLHLKSDVITLHCEDPKPQLISGQKTFENLFVYGDVNVHGLVNGYKLSDLAANTLTVEGDQEISGIKTFQKPVKFLGDLNTNTVNGIVLRDELIPLDTDQEITGSLTFVGNVHVDKDLEVNGLVNGVNLRQLAKDALYVDTDQDIEGSYTIDHAVVKGEVYVDSTVNDIELAEFEEKVSNFWVNQKDVFKKEEAVLQKQCPEAQRLHSILEHSYYVLNGFDLHQMVNFSADRIQTRPLYQDLFLIKIEDSNQFPSYMHQYGWNINEGTFTYTGQTRTFYKEWKTFNLERNEISLRIGIKTKDSVVVYNGEGIPEIDSGFTDGSALMFDQVAIVAVLYSTRNICQMYQIEAGDGPSVHSLGNLKIERAKSVAIFEINNVIYLAFARYFSPDLAEGSSEIYAYIKDDWQIVQNTFPSASFKVSHFSYHGFHYLMFTDVAPSFDTKEPQSIQVYRNTENQNLPFALFQKIPFDGAKSFEIFEFGGLQELYLVAFNETRVQVFLLEGETGFTSNYVIHGKCITAAKPIVLGTQLYLIIGQNDKESSYMLPTKIYKGLTQGTAVAPKRLTFC